jgi:hypothetical protein
LASFRDDKALLRGEREGRNGDSKKPFMFITSIESPFIPSLWLLKEKVSSL